MIYYRHILLVILLAFSMPYTYGGCVFIYSSGDVDPHKENVDGETTEGFVGVASQAAITQMNAEALSLGAFAGGLTSVEPEKTKLNRRSNAARIDVIRPLKLPLVLEESLRKIKIDPALLVFNQTDIITESDNLEGTCGGDDAVIDSSTLRGRVMAGYQGWFMTADDGSGMGWRHWAPGTPTASNIDFDMWPDVREYDADELKSLSKDVAEIWLQASYNPIFDMEGSP